MISYIWSSRRDSAGADTCGCQGRLSRRPWRYGRRITCYDGYYQIAPWQVAITPGVRYIHKEFRNLIDDYKIDYPDQPA